MFFMNQPNEHITLFRSLPFPSLLISVSELGFMVADVNEAYLRATGLVKTSMVGKPVTDLVPYNAADPGFVNSFMDSMMAAAKGETAIIPTLCSFQPAGPEPVSLLYWRITHTHLPATEQGEKYILQTAEDLTLQVQAAQQVRELNKDLRLSQERYELVTRATFDAAWDWDIVNDHIYSGAGFESIFGYTMQDVGSSKRDWQLHIHPDDVNRVFQGLQKRLSATDDNWIDKYRYRRADGEYCMVMDRAVIIRNDSGQAIRMIGVMRDISDEVKREEQAKLVYRVAGYFNTEPDLESAMDKTIRDILEYTGAVVAECWAMDYSGSALLLTAQASVREDLFVKNEITKLQIGDGAPGQVWLNRSVIYIENVQHDPGFVRKKFAEANGLVSCIAVPLYYRGKLLGVITVYSDRQQRQSQFKTVGQDTLNRLAENMQRKIMETEMNLFFDLTPDLLVVAGTDGYFKKLNPAFINTLGYSQMELLSIPFMHFVPLESRNTVEEIIDRLAQGETVVNEEISLLSKSGVLIQLSWSAIMVFKEQLIVGTAKDITAKKKAELEVLHRTRRINEILESIGDGFFAIDQNRNIEYWNRISEAAFGLSKEEVLGKNSKKVFSSPDFSFFFKQYEEVRRTGETRHYERYNAAFGKWFDISIYPAFNDTVSVFFRDVTQRVNYVKAIEEQNTKLQEIAWTQSHIVRAPLSRIMGIAGLLKDTDPGSPEFSQLIGFLQTSAEELDEVIRKIVEHAGKVNPGSE